MEDSLAVKRLSDASEWTNPAYRPAAWVLPGLQLAEMVSNHLACYRLAKLPPRFQRVEEVETGIDPGPEDLIHQIPRICESVLVKAVGECLAVDDESDAR